MTRNCKQPATGVRRWDWHRYGRYIITSTATAGLLTIVSCFAPVGLRAYARAVPEIFPVGNPLPVVGTTSGTSEIQLAQHLSNVGAKYYGAWWCPHCHQQNALFGRQANEYIDYIECDREGRNPQLQLCEAAELRGYPTWEIDDEQYEGVQSLEVLADLSGYTGPRDFMNESSFR